MIKKVNDNFVFIDTGEIIEAKFNYSSPAEYIQDGVKYVVPQTAKEEDREEELEKLLNSPDVWAETKLDGTRCTQQLFKNHTRLFSRRISVKTNWFSENTNLLPQLSYLECSELEGTVIDGELSIPNRPFKDVASTMNCLWDEAIKRQMEIGYVVLNAFDIIWYKNIYVARLPLHRRKQLLKKVVDLVDSKYLKELEYFSDTTRVRMSKDDEAIASLLSDLKSFKVNYPNLYTKIENTTKFELNYPINIPLTKLEYYEWIVSNGGEGIILKDKNGKYFHKRGREYTKLKKFLTKDVIITDFLEPTKEYKGKLPDSWQYWEDEVAVSKYYAEGWVGNIEFGVIVDEEDIKLLNKSKKSKEFKYKELNGNTLLIVGECSGFDEEQREEFSQNREKYIGTVIEVKANEIFKDTGKLRHPRFNLVRNDKNVSECTFKTHINK